MTDEKNTGGQAYPAAWGNSEQGGDYIEGMTLRDWFAGQALASNGGKVFHDETGGSAVLLQAQWAYLLADAMLEARK